MHSNYKRIKLEGYNMKNFRRKFNTVGVITFSVKAKSSKDADRLILKYLESEEYKINTHLDESLLVSTRITQISSFE